MGKNDIDIDEFREIMRLWFNTILDGFKTENYKKAIDTVEKLEEMDDEEFANLVQERIGQLSENEQIVANKVISDRRENYNDNALSLRETILLDIQTMIDSSEASKRHYSETDKINFGILHQLDNCENISLAPEEIRFLDRIQGAEVNSPNIPSYFTHEYHMDFNSVLSKLISGGYITFGSVIDDVKLADMPTLRKLAKAKKLKSGGKKTDIIERVINNYSEDELKDVGLPNHYVVTESGRNILKKNDALIKYYLNFASRDFTTPEHIIDEQEKHPNEDGTDILIRIISEKLKTEDDNLSFYHFLRQMYMWKKDEDKIQEISHIIRDLEEKFNYKYGIEKIR